MTPMVEESLMETAMKWMRRGISLIEAQAPIIPGSFYTLCATYVHGPIEFDELEVIINKSKRPGQIVEVYFFEKEGVWYHLPPRR